MTTPMKSRPFALAALFTIAACGSEDAAPIAVPAVTSSHQVADPAAYGLSREDLRAAAAKRPPTVSRDHAAQMAHGSTLSNGEDTETILDAVRAIHGAAGPYAVAGYRMGQRALRELGAERADDDIEVVHASPAEVRWSCIADGLQASTGASLGHLNLSRVEAPEANVHSIVRRRSTGRYVELRLNTEFIDSLGPMNDDNLEELGARVARASDDELFTMSAGGETPGGQAEHTARNVHERPSH